MNYNIHNENEGGKTKQKWVSHHDDDDDQNENWKYWKWFSTFFLFDIKTSHFESFPSAVEMTFLFNQPPSCDHLNINLCL